MNNVLEIISLLSVSLFLTLFSSVFDQYISNVNLLQGEGKDVLHRSMNISCRFVSFGIVIPSQNLANIIRPSLPFFPYEFTIVPIIENNP